MAGKANPFEEMKKMVDKAGKTLELDQGMIEVMKSPKRELTVNFPVKMSGDVIKVFTGYRVHANVSRGPAKGGIRYGRPS